MQPIPEDIISYIVGSIDEKDRSTLRSCNSAARIFRSSCQKRLFATLRMSFTPESMYEARNKWLHELLTKSPNVGSCVKELNVVLSNGGADFNGIKLLSLFPRLRNLVILSGEVAMIWWRKLPGELQDSVSKLLELPSLERLTLSYIADFPMSVLSGATSLRFLDLDSITPSNEKAAVQTCLQSVRNLETLRLTTMSTEDLAAILGDFRKSLSSGPDPVLRELELQTSSMLQDSIAIVQDVLGAVITTLKQLVITAGDGDCLDLSELCELEFLAIFFPEYSEDALPWLCSTLKTIPPNNKIKSLTFTFWPYETFIMDADWADLDSELSIPGKYHANMRIRLSGLRHDFRYFMKELAPRIASRKNVEIFNGTNLVDWRPSGTDIQITEVPTYFDDSEHDEED